MSTEQPATPSPADQPLIGPLRLPRQPTEPNWLCDGAYLDEHGRTWHCGHATHPLGHHHQAWVYSDADGNPGEVDWEHRLEWADRW